MIPAIVVKQPFASLLVAGVKDVENRSWSTEYPQLIICAGALSPEAMLPTRVALGLVVFRERPSVSVWALAGYRHWCVEGIHPFRVPVPVRGMPGIFDASAALAEYLRHAPSQRQQLRADHDLRPQLAALFGLPDWLISLRRKPVDFLLDYSGPRGLQKLHQRPA
jgi:hypothetical protein